MTFFDSVDSAFEIFKPLRKASTVSQGVGLDLAFRCANPYCIVVGEGESAGEARGV